MENQPPPTEEEILAQRCVAALFPKLEALTKNEEEMKKIKEIHSRLYQQRGRGAFLALHKTIDEAEKQVHLDIGFVPQELILTMKDPRLNEAVTQYNPDNQVVVGMSIYLPGGRFAVQSSTYTYEYK